MLRNWLIEWQRLGQISSTRGGVSRRRRLQLARMPHHAEVLEDRTLLSTFYVDNVADYVITNDQGNTGLDDGDTVTWDSTATHPAGPVAGLIFGTDAFVSIQAASNAAQANGGLGDTIVPDYRGSGAYR
jgi:hypothetical protein